LISKGKPTMRKTIFGTILICFLSLLFVGSLMATAPPVFILGNILVDIRENTCRPIHGLGISGLEYGIPHVDNLICPARYPGTAGTDYFVPSSSQFQSAKSLGSRVVRLPFDLGRLVPGSLNINYVPGKDIVFDQVYLGYLRQCLGMAQDYDQLLILDMHNYLYYIDDYAKKIFLINDSLIHRELLNQTWTQLVQEFANSPALFGYEIMNEPNKTSHESNWLSIAQSAINRIREVDSDHFVFVNGKTFSSAGGWLNAENDNLEKLTDTASKLVFTPHLYADSNYNGKYDGEIDDYPPDGWKSELYRLAWGAIKWSREYNKPLLFGEVGFLTKTDAWDIVFKELLREYLMLHNVGIILWALEPEDIPHQDTYILGESKAIAKTFAEYSTKKINFQNRNGGDYIFHNNLQNGYQVYAWEGVASRILEAGGLDNSPSLSIHFNGNWSDGFDIASKNIKDEHSDFDIRGSLNVSFYYKGEASLRTSFCDESISGCGQIIVTPRQAELTKIEIPITQQMLPSSGKFDRIKFQTGDGAFVGDIILDEIILTPCIQKRTQG